MCNRHSFILTRAGKIHDGLGVTDSHTTIREFAGLKDTDDTVNAYEWQPPKGWPDADWLQGLTKDVEVFEPKLKHLRAMESHVKRLYPTTKEWNAPDPVRLRKGHKIGGGLDLRGTNITALPDNLTVGGGLDLSSTNITALPDNLTVGGGLYLPWGCFSTVSEARAAQARKVAE